jgi:peptide-methionine (S)-S-oxide reductase
MSDHLEKAILGGGCFWCLEAVFQKVKGVHRVVSGYAGGHIVNPSYEAVCSESTGHAEVVEITFDPKVIEYRQLLGIFFVIHDPTTLNYQGNDMGTQYRSVIYACSEEQLEIAEHMIAELEQEKLFKNPIVTEVMMAPIFYSAEDYHQNYYQNHPFQGYCMAVVGPKVSKFKKNFADLLNE